jgi:Ca2+-binding RTX toxin-like protein
MSPSKILHSEGTIVAQNDDGGGDPGSASNRDSSLVSVIQKTGTYYILEGSWSETTPGDGWTEAVPTGSKYELNVSVEFSPAPAMPGVAGADTLDGGSGSDLLDGGLMADTLTGGAEEDTFRFSTALGNGNVDWINDFNVTEDTILLDNLIFAGVVGDGELALGAFYRSATGAAHDADDRIIYDTDSGALSYDADGAGQLAAIQYARLGTNLNLSADNFRII